MNYLVIPAYRPDLHLIHLLQKVKEKSSQQIIVVNDGSPANDDSIFRETQKYATILCHTTNQGKGQALKTVFSYIDSLG